MFSIMAKFVLSYYFYILFLLILSKIISCRQAHATEELTDMNYFKIGHHSLSMSTI